MNIITDGGITFNTGFFTEAFNRSIERIENDPVLFQDEQALEKGKRILSSPATNRPHVFVAEMVDDTPKKPILDYVNNPKNFKKLLGLLTDVERVTTYCGSDASEVIVLQARLPDNYVARVPYIRLRHIPQIYKHNGQIVVKEVGNVPRGQGDRECLHFCPEVYPVWTHRENNGIVSEEIYRGYHYVTIKIRREDGSIKRWNPGLDKSMAAFQSLQEVFVLVGRPYPKPFKTLVPKLEERSEFLPGFEHLDVATRSCLRSKITKKVTPLRFKGFTNRQKECQRGGVNTPFQFLQIPGRNL